MVELSAERGRIEQDAYRNFMDKTKWKEDEFHGAIRDFALGVRIEIIKHGDKNYQPRIDAGVFGVDYCDDRDRPVLTSAESAREYAWHCLRGMILRHLVTGRVEPPAKVSMGD